MHPYPNSTVIQNDTRTGKLILARDIQLENTSLNVTAIFIGIQEKYTIWISIKLTFVLARVSSKTTLMHME